MTPLATNLDFSVSRLSSFPVQRHSKVTNGTEPWKEKNRQTRHGQVVTTWPNITGEDYSIWPCRDDVASVPTSMRRELSECYREMLSYKELEDGWDDISSQAIPAEVIDTALAFFRCLPSEILEPEASASGDGTVDWYWRNGAYTALVTFYPDSRVAYSAMTGSGSDKGRFKFSGSIPDGLIESLKQL